MKRLIGKVLDAKAEILWQKWAAHAAHAVRAVASIVKERSRWWSCRLREMAAVDLNPLTNFRRPFLPQLSNWGLVELKQLNWTHERVNLCLLTDVWKENFVAEPDVLQVIHSELVDEQLLHHQWNCHKLETGARKQKRLRRNSAKTSKEIREYFNQFFFCVLRIDAKLIESGCPSAVTRCWSTGNTCVWVNSETYAQRLLPMSTSFEFNVSNLWSK